MNATIQNRGRKHRQGRHREGAAAVEFAVAISVLLLIVFAAIEFTRMSMVRHAVKHSSYVAARRAMIVGATRSDAEAAAMKHLQKFGIVSGNLALNPATITDDTEIIEVTIDVPVGGNSWIAPIFFGSKITGRTRILAERAAAEMGKATAVPSV